MSTFIDAITVNNHQAIVIPDGPSLTYFQLAQNVAHLQQIFTNSKSPLSGASTQCSIGISIPNSLEFVVSFLAIVNTARIAAPLNFNYKKNEFDFYLGDLDAKAIFVPRGFRRQGNQPIIQSAIDNHAYIVEVFFDKKTNSIEYEVFSTTSTTPVFVSKRDSAKASCNLTKFSGKPSPEDVAMILHTSGTTGRPKAVPLTHRNITASMRIISGTYSLNSDDTTYVVMPLFHVHGLIGALFSTFYSQGTAIIAPKFSAHNFWKDFITYKATWYSAVPTIHQILLKVGLPKGEVPKIRFIRSCSSALAPANLEKLEQTFRAPVVEAMGMTECAHCVTSNNLPQFGKRKPGTVGQAHGVEIVILNERNEILKQGEIGEVSIKGENVTKGYLNNPKANAENFTAGYFRTGDQGYFDKDNFLTLTGRIKELINRGGEKISPIELDNVMLTYPKVAEAVAFGVEDEKYGQVVHAAIVLAPNASLTLEEFQKYLKTKIASFKVPEKVYFVDKLPKTPTGKIQRRTLPKIFARKSKL
ncbi:Pcs60 protein [Saccharomycopsis crataegensis]|uniref:Pcs60 protein n=1 Tax=Saccharomycopsis crataegensis TaxID=43959 RepID=A0AAV5QUB9_9ASCO|nr:Pcs60 protein [Saccharomycopsis crataegensis]